MVSPRRGCSRVFSLILADLFDKHSPLFSPLKFAFSPRLNVALQLMADIATLGVVTAELVPDSHSLAPYWLWDPATPPSTSHDHRSSEQVIDIRI